MNSADRGGFPAPGLIAFSFVFTVAAVSCLWAGLPTVQNLPGWFWPIRRLPHPDLRVVVATTASTGILVWIAVRSGSLSAPWRICSLVAAGLCLQYGCALAEGRGMAALSDRLLKTGHAEFLHTAVRSEDWTTIVGSYDQFVSAPDQVYARSKPPGHLLFYVAVSRVADLVVPGGSPVDRFVRAAVVLFPVLSYVVLFPLYGLARTFMAREHAIWAPALCVLTPQTALVTMHLDQVLYPLLAVLQVFLTVKACSTASRRPVWVVAAAGAHWIALFVSFSLVPVCLVAIAFALDAVAGEVNAWRRVALRAAQIVAAVVALTALVWWATGYNPVATYGHAMTSHAAWRHWQESDRLPMARLAGVEFLYWSGPAAAVVLACALWAGLVRCISGRRSRLDLAALGTLCVLAATALLGRTKGEFARLWLFAVPFVCVAWAGHISSRRPGSDWSLGGILLAIQIVWVLTLKLFQDFH